LVAGFGFAVFLQRKRRGSMKRSITSPIENDVGGAIADDGVFLSEASQTSLVNGPGRIEPSSSPAADPADIQAQGPLSAESAKDHEIPAASKLPEEPSMKNGIVVSSEMEAVMQTLTARERAVISTLIDHGGRMTQADIRYETGTPKSSLTGILISLERRKLVSKKEWGRTNIIELSDWFLSKKERS
jgi:uncharacterized membrane protein